MALRGSSSIRATAVGAGSIDIPGGNRTRCCLIPLWLVEVECADIGSVDIDRCPLGRIVGSSLVEIKRGAARGIGLASHNAKGGGDGVLPGAIGCRAEDGG